MDYLTAYVYDKKKSLEWLENKNTGGADPSLNLKFGHFLAIN